MAKWIRFRALKLFHHPKIAALAARIGPKPVNGPSDPVPRYAVMGALGVLWNVVNDHRGPTPGILLGEIDSLDRITGLQGMGAALEEIGWVSRVTESDMPALLFTDWAEWNSFDPTAAERKRKERDRKRHVTRDSHGTVTANVTLQDSDSDSDSEEKKRKNSPAGSEKENRAPARTPPTKKPGAWSTVAEGLKLVSPSPDLRSAWELRLKGLLERPLSRRPLGTALRTQGSKCERLAQDTSSQAAVDLLTEATEGGWMGLPPAVVEQYRIGSRHSVSGQNGAPMSRADAYLESRRAGMARRGETDGPDRRPPGLPG